MTQRTWRGIRIEQCTAAEAIRLRHGIEPAFDCIAAGRARQFELVKELLAAPALGTS